MDERTDRQTDQKHAYTDVLKNTPITLGNAIHSMPMRDNKIGKKYHPISNWETLR